ncbi:MAG TPA: hypothetical protein VJH71_00995 [Candidatus Paceibacterota bacterium]
MECPSCGVDVATELRRKELDSLFEKEYRGALKTARSRSIVRGRITGMILGFILWCLVALVLRGVTVDSLSETPFLALTVFLFGLSWAFVGFFAGKTMFTCKEEKDCRESFNKRHASQ